ncbi:hypothetical protein GSF22_24460 [Micromonospora echinofusca]|uniref:tRNA nuclease CdiA C-terminal domain-containing protein n=1 Tax=Micromonospora echinofusca TaxID=47858 RepID=A0ABS3VX60_MICEH|nr:hypothetical protein [Micromonospora echinofusca]
MPQQDQLPPWERGATGIENGTPTGPHTRIGARTDDSTRKALELENECADTVAARGYRVHQNPTAQQVGDARDRTGDHGNPDKDPDYLIEGHAFDCYSPQARTSVRNVWSQVREKIDDEQTQRVMLNLKEWEGNIMALRRQFDQWPIDGLKELAVVTRDGTIRQIVRED